MSIIQDALKKAQQERKKKNSREIPYHLSGVQKKPKTVLSSFGCSKETEDSNNICDSRFLRCCRICLVVYPVFS